MKKKATDFVYLNTKSYLSTQQLLTSVALLAVFASILFELGSMTKNWTPAIVAGGSLFAYIAFVWMIISGRIKNSFPLRFLVNGTSLLFLSILWSELCFAFVSIAEPKMLSLLLPVGILYVIFSLLYVGFTVIGVHVGIYGHIRHFNNMPAVVAINAVLSSFIPVAGVLGMLHGRELRLTLASDEQINRMFMLGVALAFLCALGHVNFVQYYYCIKYSILCDENGDTTSPKLIPAKKAESTKDSSADLEKEQPKTKPKSLLKTIVRAILILLAIPVAVVILTVVAAAIYTFFNHV